MNPKYFDYFVLFFFIVIIIAMTSKILRLQTNVMQEGMESSTTSTDTCSNTIQPITDIIDKITKKTSSLTTLIKNNDRTQLENMITAYHDMISVWCIHDLMATDSSNSECLNKMIARLSLYGNATKCLETSLHWLDEQPI
jgi:hypothetical protein